MRGKITIELTTEITDSGSKLPDLAHDAYWLKKQIHDLVYTAKDGTETRMADKYTVTRINADAQA